MCKHKYFSLKEWRDLDVIWWREDIPEWAYIHPIGDLIDYDGKLLINTFYNKHRAEVRQ